MTGDTQLKDSVCQQRPIRGLWQNEGRKELPRPASTSTVEERTGENFNRNFWDGLTAPLPQTERGEGPLLKIPPWWKLGRRKGTRLDCVARHRIHIISNY